MAFDLNAALADIIGGSYGTGSTQGAPNNPPGYVDPAAAPPPSQTLPQGMTPGMQIGNAFNALPQGGAPPPGGLTRGISVANPGGDDGSGPSPLAPASPPPQQFGPPAPPGLAAAVAPPPGGPLSGAPPPGGVPMPVPAPGMAPPLPPPQTIAGPTGPTPAPPPGGQALPVPPPRPATPPPMAGAPPPQGGATPSGPWMSNVLGKDPRANQQFVGSLAAGLKSVGDNWNKPGLAAFAGSAGAALEGGQKGDKEFFEQTRQAKDEELKYRAEGNKEKTDAAKLKYQQDRLAAAQKAGTVNGRQQAWQSSEHGRFLLAEKQIQAEVESARKTLQPEMLGADPARKKEIEDHLKDVETTARKRMYQGMGIDENQAQKLKTMGQSRDNPHSPNNWDEFNEFVKPGQWFTNPADGKILQRKSGAPPPADAPGGILATTPNSLDEVPDTFARKNFGEAA